MPLKIVRNYPPYYEARNIREARAAIVELRLSGWRVKAIASYLEIHHSTVYRTLARWKEGGFEGLADGSPGRPPGVRKADLAAVEAIRKLARNPGLGAFRVHATMRQMGFDLSRATRARFLARVARGLMLREGRGREATKDAVRRLGAARSVERGGAPPGHGRRGPRGLG